MLLRYYKIITFIKYYYSLNEIKYKMTDNESEKKEEPLAPIQLSLADMISGEVKTETEIKEVTTTKVEEHIEEVPKKEEVPAEDPNLSHHSERIEHEEIEHDLNLNVKPLEEEQKEEKKEEEVKQEEEKAEEEKEINHDEEKEINHDEEKEDIEEVEKKKKEEEEEINQIMTTNEIGNSNNLQNNNEPSPSQKFNKQFDLLNNLSSGSNNLNMNDSFDRKLQELRDRINQNRSPKKKINWNVMSPSASLTQSTSPNKKLGELFNLMGPMQKFSSANTRTNLPSNDTIKYKPLIATSNIKVTRNIKDNTKIYDSFKKGMEFKIKPLITNTNAMTTGTFLGMGQLGDKKKSSYCPFNKDYFKEELSKFDEKLFGRGMSSGSGKSTLSQSRRFNRLNLVI